MAGKFSGAGIKAFFINHGEKVALGVITLLVLFALATANWIPYGGDPIAIKRAAEQAKVDYDARVITPEEAESLELVIKPENRPAALVERQLLADWSAGKYDLPVPLAVSLNDTKQPLKEAQDLFAQHPIRNLKADSGWVILNLGPDTPAAPATTPAEDPGAPPPLLAGGPVAGNVPGGPNLSDLDDQFGRRNAAAGGAAGQGPGGMGGAEYMSGFASPELMYYDAYASGEMPDGTGGGGMSYAGTQLKGRGQFFASVRGIIPLHELIRDVALARNLDFAQAAAYFQLIDYHLERQATDANGRWPADDQWEVVDRETAISVLKEVDGFDLDPVPPQLTDVAVTMPLPPRITGVWGKHATHPDIESFSLSQADMENEMKYQVALLTTVQEQQAQMKTALQQNQGPQVKGWNDVAYNSRQLAADLYGGGGPAFATSYESADPMTGAEGLYGSFGAVGPQENDPKFLKLVKDLETVVNKDAKDKALTEYIKKRVTAVGNLLLFRFVDFAVEPGKSYRYRARLELENPSFGEHVASAEAPSVVEGETRVTAWSNITDPVSINKSTYYFVHRLDPRRNVAELDFHHYDSALGTIVTNIEPDPPEDDPNAVINRLAVGYGEPIGGTPVVWELCPGKYTFAKDETDGTKPIKDPKPAPSQAPITGDIAASGPAPVVVEDTDPIGYAFNTGDLLVAGLEDYKLTPSEHPDLIIPKANVSSLQLVDAILVQKQDGRLEQIDTVSQAPWRDYMAIIIGKQNTPWRELKQGPMDAGSELCPDQLAMLGYMAGMPAEGADARRSDQRTRSMLRKSKSRADAAARNRISAER